MPSRSTGNGTLIANARIMLSVGRGVGVGSYIVWGGLSYPQQTKKMEKYLTSTLSYAII